MNTLQSANTIRKYHRYLGFFLTGIMTVYALSGTLLIFRSTDFLKYEQTTERELDPGLPARAVAEELRVRGFKVVEESEEILRFDTGTYNKATGAVVMTEEDYTPVIAKMVKLHKATTSSPMYYLNIFFGASLLFFALSSFFMFLRKLPAYKTGLKFAAGGFVLAVAMVAIG